MTKFPNEGGFDGAHPATVTTLFVVPIIYTYMHHEPPTDYQRRLIEREREVV